MNYKNINSNILHISDLHIGGRYKLNRLKSFLLSTISFSKINYLVVSGDIVENKNFDYINLYIIIYKGGYYVKVTKINIICNTNITVNNNKNNINNY